MWTAANCAAHLPRGGAVGEFYGGMMAIDPVVEALRYVEVYTARAVTDKPNRVKPRALPEGIRARQRAAKFAASQAEAWLRKQRQREGDTV